MRSWSIYRHSLIKLLINELTKFSALFDQLHSLNDLHDLHSLVPRPQSSPTVKHSKVLPWLSWQEHLTDIHKTQVQILTGSQCLSSLPKDFIFSLITNWPNSIYCKGLETSLVPRPSITANTVEGLVKLLHRMMSGGRLEAWHFWWTAVLVHARHDKPRIQTSTWCHYT